MVVDNGQVSSATVIPRERNPGEKVMSYAGVRTAKKSQHLVYRSDGFAHLSPDILSIEHRNY